MSVYISDGSHCTHALVVVYCLDRVLQKKRVGPERIPDNAVTMLDSGSCVMLLRPDSADIF
jgi:hypothetical protein